MKRRLMRTLAPIIRALRAVDRAAGRFGGRRTVLVEARTPMNLAVLRPVLAALSQDPRLRIRFTGHPRQDLRQAFEEMGIASGVISRRRAAWTRVDLYINADPWDAVSLWRAARQLNFFHGVAGKYNLDRPETLPMAFDRYDRVAFPNKGRLENYVSAGIVPRERTALVGYPKADALVADARGPRAYATDLGLDATRPTVIYAPTFSPASSLHEAGEAIVHTLLQGGFNVIVKLHDRSLDPDPRYNGGVNWRERLAGFDPARFLFASSGDSTKYVLASDAMITDHSSIGFEFCALDRPLVIYDAPQLIEAARINPEKVALLRAAATVVTRADQIPGAIAAALADPQRHANARRIAAEEVFHAAGGATSRALALIYELLDLAPATQATVAQEARAWSGK